MGRDATKAAGNPWYQARKKAAEYDDRLCSRESAAEQLGMSVSSLADAELGNTKFMPVDKAVLMADRYNAPWLLNHYCLNECPIGCRHSLSDEVVGIDRVTVKLLKSLKTEKLGDVKDTLLDIAADGKITEDEKPALQEVLAYEHNGYDDSDWYAICWNEEKQTIDKVLFNTTRCACSGRAEIDATPEVLRKVYHYWKALGKSLFDGRTNRMQAMKIHVGDIRRPSGM